MKPFVPVRVTFDNNFLDAFSSASPDLRREVLRSIECGALEIFANYEVLLEVQGLATTSRSGKLAGYSADILSLTEGRFLNLLQPLLESEALGRPQKSMDRALRNQIVRYLEQAGSGHIPTAAAGLANKAIAEKQQALDEFRIYESAHTEFLRGVKELPKQQRKKAIANYRAQLESLGFDEVRHSWVNRWGPKYLARLLESWGVGKTPEIIQGALAGSPKFRRLATWLSIQALPTFRYRVKGERKHSGDLYDLRQMLYLVDMDVYVTDDARLSAWYHDVFGQDRRIMSADEFLATNWCRCRVCWFPRRLLRSASKWIDARREYIAALEVLDALGAKAPRWMGKWGLRAWRWSQVWRLPG